MNDELFTFVLFGGKVVVTLWKVIGVCGALLFASRWLVSAYYSRKAGKPVTPRLFWVMSICGSLITLGYFIFSPKQDLVGVIQNLLPFGTACYMLYLDFVHEKKAEEAKAAASAAVAATEHLHSEPRKAISARVVKPVAAND